MSVLSRAFPRRPDGPQRRVWSRLIPCIGLTLLLGGLLTPVALGQTRTVVVQATNPAFIRTGVVLPPGGSARLTATGAGTCNVVPDSGCPAGGYPNGTVTCQSINYGPGPAGEAIPADALAGRLGNGPPFLIGKGTTIHGQGELQLVFQDCANAYYNNGGSYTVKISTHGADTILSGRVTRYVCRDTEYLKMGGDNASFCLLTSVKPVGNVEVLAAGKHFRSARTRSDGSYEVAVPRGGAYTVSIFGSVGGHLPSRRFGASATVRPSSYHVSGTADVRDLNFQLCKPPSEPFAGGGVAEYSGPKLPCGVKLYEFSGTLLDIYGQPVDGQYVAIDPNAERVHAAPGDEFQTGGLDDAIQTDSRGHFQLFVERGTHEVWAGTVERLRTVSISRDTTGVQLEIKPIIVDASGYPNQVVVNTYGLPTSPPNGFFVTIAHSPVADTICQYRVPAANTHYTRIVPASFVPFGFVPSFHKFCSGDWTASLFSAREPQQIIASQPFTVK